MDELILRGYQHVVDVGGWNGQWLSEATGAPLDRLDEVHQTLAELRVIERDHGGGWRAVSPRVAMAELVTPIDAELQRRAAQVESLRDRLHMLLPVHRAKQRSDVLDVVDVLDDRDTVAVLLDEQAATCGEELLIMRAEAEHCAAARGRYLAVGARGVRVQAVFQHAARHHLPAEGLMDTLSTAGADVRTADELPAELLIFDRATCVLIADGRWDHPAAGRGTAVVVRHPVVVAMLVAIFDDVWARSAPYTRDDPQPPLIDDEVRRAVLRLLATGIKDDAVARRLGISIRSCRRHVSEIMAELGTDSRFQAGVEAHRRRLV